MKKTIIKLIINSFLSTVFAVSVGSSFFLYQENRQLFAEAVRLNEFQVLASQLAQDKQKLIFDYQNISNLNQQLNISLGKASGDFNNLLLLNQELTTKLNELDVINQDLLIDIKNKTEEINSLNEKIKGLSIPPVISGGGPSYFNIPPIAPPAINQTENLQNEINTLKSLLEDALLQKQALKEQLENINLVVENLNDILAETNTQIEDLTINISNLELEKNTLQTIIDDLLSSADDSNSDSSGASNAELLEQLTLEINGLIDQIGNLTDQLIEKATTIENLQMNISSLSADRDTYKTLYDNLVLSFSETTEKVIVYLAQIVILENQIIDFEEQVMTLNQTLNDYQLMIDANNVEIASLIDTIQELNGAITSFESQIQYYIEQTGPAIDFDTLNQVSQLAVKANVKIDVGGTFGSGVVYHKVVKGNSYEFYILTNYHVILNNLRYQSEIKVSNYAGAVKTATLMAYQFGNNSEGNNSVDLAVVKVVTGNSNEYYVLNLGAVGSQVINETLISIGTPRGQINNVTVGSLIDIDSNVLLSSQVYENGNFVNRFAVFLNVFRHSALIDFGNSGGALLNLNLEIVGINFAGSPQTNTFPFQSVNGYAIPLNKVVIFLEENNLLIP